MNPINTIGELRKLIAELPDDTRICLQRDTKFGIDYVWYGSATIEKLRNQDEGCGACYDALVAPIRYNFPNCPLHSGLHLIFKF